MLLIREVFHCKPGKVRPLVEKFLAMSKLSEKAGIPKMRVITDFIGERYLTLVAEMEVASLDEFERMMQGFGQKSEEMKEMENIMKTITISWSTADGRCTGSKDKTLLLRQLGGAIILPIM